MTVGSGWSVQRAAKAGDGFVLTAPGRVTKLRAPSEQEEQDVSEERKEEISIRRNILASSGALLKVL